MTVENYYLKLLHNSQHAKKNQKTYHHLIKYAISAQLVKINVVYHEENNF